VSILTASLNKLKLNKDNLYKATILFVLLYYFEMSLLLKEMNHGCSTMNHPGMHLNRGVFEHIGTVLRWTGHVAKMKQDIHGFVVKTLIKCPVGRPRRGW
jgi:hypothetical protein